MPLAAPAASKAFYIFTGERDLEDPANYQLVQADLALVGRSVQIYLDRTDHDIPGIQRTLAEVLGLFDQEIQPWAQQHLGRVLDVDRDGRFTILLTGRLSTLQNGKVRVDGFVRGSDFFRDLPAPYSNHCDMLYLNAGLTPGPHLRTVMIHEYTHAVTFCEHALTSYRSASPGMPLGGPTNLDEESWLNEGLSHLVESQNEGGWSNLDYRISAFLARPEQYPLVVADYFGGGQWRNPGMRGAAFLFLRSCQQQTGADIARRLIQSPLRGVTNLEVASQKPFADLLRQASVDLLLPANYGYLDSAQRTPLLCGPHFQELPLAGGHSVATVAGTAAVVLQLHSPESSHARVQIDGAGPLQATLVRVPASMPRLSLRWLREADSLRLQLTAHHDDVRLLGADWQIAAGKVPSPEPVPHWFSQERIAPGVTVISVPLTVPSSPASTISFKVLGEDKNGRPVAAWIDWPN